jgi:hypothetical protein
MKLPTIKELSALIVHLKKYIDNDCIEDGDDHPSIYLTVGWSSETGEWSYQTGDNSFTGGAYHYPHWGVVSIYRRSNSKELARDIQNQLADLADWH